MNAHDARSRLSALRYLRSRIGDSPATRKLLFDLLDRAIASPDAKTRFVVCEIEEELYRFLRQRRLAGHVDSRDRVETRSVQLALPSSSVPDVGTETRWR